MIGIEITQENDMVQEITDVLERERLSPISAKDRNYAKGFIDAGLEYGKLSFAQRDELYQKWGIV